ncbi:glutaredoxin 3 [Jannaschia faecimaris]|uniref:Glutaredoxin n=1 Tax=Jannaschia faecimaris TaxID=1244108 RepID=A0A1H3J7H5_9RHOB|nr:glutaredoxin 3 [Jannaschia faecimaris]SDY35545.1 glutaredoxin 3 [Jannaschia faecimaris]
MKSVEVYTQPRCGFCTAAIRLLAKKGVPVNEIDVSRGPNRRAEMMQRAKGRHTTPQIFIGDTHVGGCDDLFALQGTGKLDAMLRD